MPFLFLGIVLILFGAFMLQLGRKKHSHEFELGSIGLFISGIVLILLYGFFYRGLTLLGG